MIAMTRFGKVCWSKRDDYWVCEKLENGKPSGKFGIGHNRDSAFLALEEMWKQKETKGNNGT